MNKEYIYLSNKEVLVSDEAGHLTKRDVESDNMSEMLSLENNLEDINKKIQELEEYIAGREELTKTGKGIILTLPFIFSFVCAAGFSLIEPNATTFDLLTCLSAGLIGTVALDIPVALNMRKGKRIREGKISELATAHKLKAKLEKMLSDVKKIEKAHEITETKFSYKPIKVVEDNTLLHNEIARELNTSYSLGYNKTKKLALKK